MNPHLRWDLRTALAFGIVLGVGLPAVVLVAAPLHLGPDSTMLPDRPGATWVSIDPIQCMGNPWEEDWLQSHNGSWESYPRELDSQRMIIIDYYSRLGITVLDARQDVWSGGVCEACSCPAGYTLYLQVWDHNVDELVALGFEVAR